MTEIDQEIKNIQGSVYAPVINGDNNNIFLTFYEASKHFMSAQQSLVGKTSRFVGRQIYIEEIKKMIDDKTNRPVTIIGSPGIGKSQLAYEFIDRYKTQFSNVILFDFTNFRNYSKFLADFALYVNLPLEEFEKQSWENKIRLILDSLARMDHVLIYADNFETISSLFDSKREEMHLEDARKIVHLLESVPSQTLVLLTSRIRKNIDGQRIMELEGLSKEEGVNLFLNLTEEEHFPNKPSKNILLSLEELSEKTGGHPFSIELLARTYGGNGLSELQEMKKHLGTYITDKKSVNERLRSLDKCFEFSLKSLNPNNTIFLAKLTMFSSYFTPQGAQEIFGINHDMLQEYHAHGLLKRIDFSQDHPIDFRLYNFHLATKNYLQKQIDMDSLELQVKDEFIQYYEKLADYTYKSLANENRTQSINRFRTMMQGEHDFEKAALLNNAKSSFIYANLCLILQNLGNLSSALEYARKALEISEKNDNDVIIARNYNNIGQILHAHGNFKEALEYTRKALQIAEDNHDNVSRAIGYNNMGQILKELKKFTEALQYTRKALQIAEKDHHDERILLRYNNNIGQILHAHGNFKEALEYTRKALQIAEKDHDDESRAIGYNNMGQILKELKKFTEALQYTRKALQIAEDNRYDVMRVIGYNNIGDILKEQGNITEAQKYTRKALQIAEDNQMT